MIPAGGTLKQEDLKIETWAAQGDPPRMGYTPLISALLRQRQVDLYWFEVSLVCIVISRTARMTQ